MDLLINPKKVGTATKTGNIIYVDVDNIKSVMDLFIIGGWMITLNQLWASIHQLVNGKSIVEKKRTWLNATFHSQSMGKGKILSNLIPKKVDYPKPNQINYEILKFTCKNANSKSFRNDMLAV